MISATEQLAGRFQLGPLLGQGGMSDVYRAVDLSSGDSVAVKIVRSGDPEFARRLAQEVKVHQRMEHEGLIRLLDTGVDDGQAYIVMELVEGATLAASLRSGPLGCRLTAKLGGILGGALAYVHAEGVVHRDVKPSNILLGADGRALLGDFGVARVVDATTMTIDGTTIGTVAYMAPEQLEDHLVGPAADIWSLGIVLLECLTGRRVYEGTSSEIIARRLAGPVPLPADLPVPWKLLLSGMLDHRPEQRLDGGQVAALLASAPFSVPWSPSPIRDDVAAATAPMDLTALAPGPSFANGANGAGATAVATAVATAEATQVGGIPIAPLSRSERRRSHHRGWAIALGVLALLVAGGSIAYALTSGTSPSSANGLHNPPRHTASTTTTVAPTTTTTTTTTLPSPPTALAALVRDVASGATNGSISTNIGQALTNLAQKAVTEAAASPDQTARDLQQAAMLIANGVQNGVISPSAASSLQSDLSALAGSLGLSAAGTAPATTTPTTAVSGPPKGHHGGPGAGGGG